MNPIVVTKSVLRYQDSSLLSTVDDVVTEYPLTIFVNEQEFATMVCTPQDLEELVIGFLGSEGVISSYGDIQSISINEKDGYAYVEAQKFNKLNLQFHSKRYITSCCGKSRQNYYFFNDARTVKTQTEKTILLSVDDCFTLMDKMQKDAALFQSTGGVHNAALCDSSDLLLSRMDIGRHNALDKIYGYCLKHGISLVGKAMVFSGRISSEVLLKVAKIGCEIVLSKSAPTSLALDMAEELGITTVGFIRRGTLNIYTHPERIAGARG